MTALLPHVRHGLRLPVLHVPHREATLRRSRGHTAQPVREARAVTALVTIATAVFGALWICAAAGLADAAWWHTLLIATVVGFALVCLATVVAIRR